MPLGCYATAGASTEADVVVADQPPPPNVEVYPSYAYEGQTVYLVNDRWYHRRGPDWVYYREEPPVLRERRTHMASAPRPPSPNSDAEARARADQQRAEARKQASDEKAVQTRKEELAEEAHSRADQQRAQAREHEVDVEAHARADQRRTDERKQEDHRKAVETKAAEGR